VPPGVFIRLRLGLYFLAGHILAVIWRVEKAIHRLRPAWNHDVSFDGGKRSLSNVESGRWSAVSFARNDERKARYPNLGRVGVENQITEDFLGVHNAKGIFRILEGEILRAISAVNDTVGSLDASLGPTGRYIYHWGIADDMGNVQDDHQVEIPTKRVYQRRLVNDTSGGYQEVLEHEWKTSSLLDMSLSIDEVAIAYLIQENGGLVHAVVRIIESGQQHEMAIPSKNFVAIEFGPVHDKLHSLFLVEADTMGRPAMVHATTVNLEILQSACVAGASVSSWECIFQCDDPAVHVDVHRTKGLEFVAINARALSTNEAYLMRQVHDKLQLIGKREQGIQYHVDVGTNRDVYTLTQGCDALEEISLFQASIDDLPLSRNFGTRVSPASNRFAIFDFDIFQKYIALYERSTVDGAHRIRLRNRHSAKSEAFVPLPPSIQNVATISPAGNMYFKSTTLRAYVDSPLVPRKLLEYDMEHGQWLTPIQEALVSGHLIQTRLLVPSKDGTMVPLSLFYRADLVAQVSLDRSVRIVLTGYGAYGASISLAYDPTLQPLLDRGCVLAFAHTRRRRRARSKLARPRPGYEQSSRC
jgi:protease II